MHKKLLQQLISQKESLKIFGNESIIAKLFDLNFTTEDTFYNYIIKQLDSGYIKSVPFNFDYYYSGEQKEILENKRILTSLEFIKKYHQMNNTNSLPEIFIKYINKNIGFGVTNGKNIIKKGTPLGFYAGPFVKENMSDNGYLMSCFGIYLDYIIDGKRGNWTSKINHNLKPNLRAISIISEYSGKPVLRTGFETIKDIMPEESLYFYYGDSFAFSIELAYAKYYNHINNHHCKKNHINNMQDILNKGFSPEPHIMKSFLDLL